MNKLLTYYKKNLCEISCDEAGRGALAGPVYAAAVILDRKKPIHGLQDSKQLTENQRNRLRIEIEDKALYWKVCSVDPQEIDKINILKASLKAMFMAVRECPVNFDIVLIDGNKLIPQVQWNQLAVVKGDGKYQSIAAASILAKTHRDEHMIHLHQEYPHYGWDQNKAYATKHHVKAIESYGLSPYHRKTFVVKSLDKTLFDE